MPSQVSRQREAISMLKDENGVHVGQRRGEGGAQAFAHVDDGVDQDADLQPADVCERGPGIVDAAEEGDGNDDDCRR